jgi:hypothetical protein
VTIRTDLPELADLLPTADVVDVKTVTGAVSLREFVAGALSSGPRWTQSVWAVRALFAKALRLEMSGIPPRAQLRPEDISFTPGDPLSFFEVVRGEEDHYLLLKVTDNHLTGHLAVTTDNASPTHEFKVVTLVHYRRTVGRVYFEVIRPFHHVIVRGMCRKGVRSSFPAA